MMLDTRIPGLKKVLRLAGKLGRPFSDNALVFLYHRVGECDSDPWSLCVSEANFEAHMRVLSRLDQTCALADLHKSMKQGNLRHGMMAVTFDDGYADNYYNALPLLKRYSIPATVFVTTGHVSTNREFWWDELQRVLIQSDELPDCLQLSANCQSHEWHLPADVRKPSDVQRQLDNTQSLLLKPPVPATAEPASRLDLYYRVWRLMQPLTHVAQSQILEQLIQWSGDERVCRSAYRAMTAPELQALADEPLVDIGAHTQTHPQLSAHADSYQSEEILHSRQRLESLCGRQIPGLAYPYGSYSRATPAIAAESGFDFACTTQDASTWRYTESLLIPRMTVLDWPGEEFERRIQHRLRGGW